MKKSIVKRNKDCNLILYWAQEWTWVSAKFIPKIPLKLWHTLTKITMILYIIRSSYLLYCLTAFFFTILCLCLSAGGGSLFAIHGDCEAYDTRTDRWHMVASMSTRRARVGVAAIGNRLYAVGGWVRTILLTFVPKLVNLPSHPFPQTLTKPFIKMKIWQAERGWFIE